MKSVGISTFGMRHMKELLDAGLPVPSVHQVSWELNVNSSDKVELTLLHPPCKIDLHPFMTRPEIVQFCMEHDVALEVRRRVVIIHPVTQLNCIYSLARHGVLLRAGCVWTTRRSRSSRENTIRKWPTSSSGGLCRR